MLSPMGDLVHKSNVLFLKVPEKRINSAGPTKKIEGAASTKES